MNLTISTKDNIGYSNSIVPYVYGTVVNLGYFINGVNEIFTENKVNISEKFCRYCETRILPEDRCCVACGAPIGRR